MSRPIVINQQTESVPVTLLRPHPRNAREGDLGAVYESIRLNGFYGYLIVQKSTNYILVGNHRFKAAVSLGFEKLPVVFVDVDDDRALRILLADNKTSDDASYNKNLLSELLSELALSTEAGLSATGWDGDELDNLIEDLAKAATPREPKEATPPKEKGEEKLAVVIVCEDEGEQEHLFDKIKTLGFYPKKATLNERTKLTA